MTSYDEWKLRSGYDECPDETEDGCTFPLTLGAGGARMMDERCRAAGAISDG